MSPILSHSWGVSPAQDRVWAQVSGLRPSRSGERVLMTLQAFVDDSYDLGAGVFVLGGCIANVESWVAFSAEWEEMLPYATLNKHGRYHFKMSEMAESPDRFERVPAFFRIIERHVSGFVSAVIDPKSIRNAIARISIDGINLDWNLLSSPYYVTFRTLLDSFHNERPLLEEAIPLNEKVDFYFDNQSEKRGILGVWDDYIRNVPTELANYYGATPRFEDDEEFLPLQAADFWAWWVRKWACEGTIEKANSLDFGQFAVSIRRKLLRLRVTITEDQLVEIYTQFLRTQVGPDVEINDSKKS